uniref:Uncharacterized protein n=1 Tax=Arundo donax TaxID=35708 RepID=A0A0A8ZMX1_ARUDO
MIQQHRDLWLCCWLSTSSMLVPLLVHVLIDYHDIMCACWRLIMFC